MFKYYTGKKNFFFEVCFSPDGRYLFNIEKPISSIATELTVYETENFQIEKRFFQGEQTLVLSHIEYDVEKATYNVLGFCRGNDGVYSFGFVTEFWNNKLIFMKRISDKEYDYINAYKSLVYQTDEFSLLRETVTPKDYAKMELAKCTIPLKKELFAVDAVLWYYGEKIMEYNGLPKKI